MRAEHDDYFADELALLESMIGFDLSDWRGGEADFLKQSVGDEMHRHAR